MLRASIPLAPVNHMVGLTHVLSSVSYLLLMDSTFLTM